MLYRMKVRVLHMLLPNIFPPLRYMPNDKERAIIQRNTNHFINTYINHTETMHSYEEFVKQASKGKYDAYVVVVISVGVHAIMLVFLLCFLTLCRTSK